MKLIIKERASGKTTMLINTSAVTGFPIVVNNRIQVAYLLELAKDMGLDIPEPLVAKDLHDRKVIAENVLIDEGYSLIETAVKNYLGNANPIAITFSMPEVRNIKVGIRR